MATPSHSHRQVADRLGIRAESVMLWDHAGLGPSPHISTERQDAHFRRLDEMPRKGWTTEHKAVVLAGEGLGCEALRQMIRERLDVELPDDRSGHGLGPSTAEAAAAGLGDAIDDGSALTPGLWHAMRAGVRDAGSVIPGEMGEHAWQSHAVDLFSALLGGAAPFEAEPLGDAAGAPDGDIDAGWAFLRNGRELLDRARRTVEVASVDVLGAFVPLVRTWVSSVFDRRDQPRPTDQALTALAAYFTPVFIAMVDAGWLTLGDVATRQVRSLAGLAPRPIVSPFGDSYFSWLAEPSARTTTLRDTT